MHSLPDFPSFAPTYEARRGQVVWTKLVADLETPVSVMLKLAAGESNNFLFESVEGGTAIGRYSFIGIKPDVIWRCHGEQAEINRDAERQDSEFVPCAKGARRHGMAVRHVGSTEDVPDI